MTRTEALEILEVSPSATTAEVERAYGRLYNDLRMRIDNAPTPAIRRRFEERRRELEEARAILAGPAGRSSFDDLPASAPIDQMPEGTSDASRRTGAAVDASGARMAAPARAGATLVVRGPEACQIFVDGESVGVLQAGARLRLEVIPGAHELLAIAADGRRWEAEVRTPMGEQVIASIALPPVVLIDTPGREPPPGDATESGERTESAPPTYATGDPESGARTQRRWPARGAAIVASVAAVVVAVFMSNRPDSGRETAALKGVQPDTTLPTTVPTPTVDTTSETEIVERATPPSRQAVRPGSLEASRGVEAESPRRQRRSSEPTPSTGAVSTTSRETAPPPTSVAELYRTAKAAYDQKNYDDALTPMRAAAEQGSADAQYQFGQMYRNGYGVAKDATAAARWFRRAADQGSRNGQHWLGHAYLAGDGVAADTALAVRWFRRAAEQGDVAAQRDMGNAYSEGTMKDAAEARRWYRLAAGQGDASSQARLGVLYLNGDGGAQDRTEAMRWFRLAADQGRSDAQFALGMMYHRGWSVQVDRAEAIKWYRRAAAQGVAAAQAALKELGDTP